MTTSNLRLAPGTVEESVTEIDGPLVAGCHVLRTHKHRILLICQCSAQFIYELEEFEEAKANGATIVCSVCKSGLDKRAFTGPDENTLGAKALKLIEAGVNPNDAARQAGIASSTAEKLYWRYVVGERALTLENEYRKLLVTVDELEVANEALQKDLSRSRQNFASLQMQMKN